MSILQDFQRMRQEIGREKYDAIQLYLDEISPPQKHEAFTKDLHDYEMSDVYTTDDWVNKRDELKLKHGIVFLDEVLYSQQEWAKFDAWYSARSISASVPQALNKGMEDNKMSYYNSKPSREPQTVESLTAKLDECKQLQETMKAVNDYWRKTGTCMGAPGITDEQAKKIDNKIVNARYSSDRQPYSSYDLTNNNAAIKRLESKVKEVSKGFSGWTFEGGEAVVNNDINRLQLLFDERPDRDKCAVLKHNGFKWSPTEGAWQRQLTDNAIYSAGHIDFIKPSDGRTVREHQPKAPARDAGAR